MAAAPLITIRAGRSARRTQADSPELVCWKDGASSSVVEDLIIFPGDASFLPVAQSPRSYVLKFSSSDARHFFWMQDPDSSKDAEQARRINEIIEAPESEDSTPTNNTNTAEDVNMDGSSATDSTSRDVAASNRQNANASTSDQFAAILAQFAAQQGQANATQNHSNTDAYEIPYTLPDVLTPTSVSGLLSDSTVQETLFQYLPTGVEHNQETLRKIINSTELRRSLSTLDTALRTGALQPLVVSLGLEPDAALGLDNFLQAVQRKADRERGADNSNSQSDAMQE